MLQIVIGTRAQMIKMAPVLKELDARHADYCLWLTGQHQVTMAELLTEFQVQVEPRHLYRGPEVKSFGQVVPWLREVLRRASTAMPAACSGDVFVAHGDTFSTLLGIYLGRRRAGRIAHVESGLRSFNLINPFPEELIRRLSMRYSDIAFAPGEWAARNLAGSRAMVVDTVANTLLDTVRFALARIEAADVENAGVLFSIHRFETLYSRRRSRQVIEFVSALAERSPVTFVLHPSTENRFKEQGLLRYLETIPSVRLLPRMTYLPFMTLALSSRLVVTDGGSNQEELSYLGVPTILMRAATERQEGLDENVILGEFDFERMSAFAETALLHGQVVRRELPDIYPTVTIVERLVEADRGGD